VNSGLPRHVLTGYWQNFANDATPLRLSDINSYYSLIAVAFATADPNTPGGVTFDVNGNLSDALGGYTDAQFASDIATLHARGKKVIISVGGGGSTVDVSSPTEASNFADSIYGLMQTYGFDGVDIDIESGIDPDAMASALRQLRSKVGSRLIITMAPQTTDMQSPSDSYFQLALSIQNILTLVNMQYYNSGSMYGCGGSVYGEGTEDFLTALACVQIVEGLSPSQIGLGLPASPPGATGGYMPPSMVNQGLTCLVSGKNCDSYVPPQNWDIGGAMDWSINWDASNSYNFANTVGPELARLA
jgi:chitinase